MARSLRSKEHLRLCSLLRDARQQAGLRQDQVAAALGRPQSFVAKYEGAERRLDLVELREICDVLGVSLLELVAAFLSKRDSLTR
jgi:transcriptional regulator with XRE-family HTH domain